MGRKIRSRDYVPIYSEKIGVQFGTELAGPDANCDGVGEIYGSLRRSSGDHSECVWEGQGCVHWSRSGRDESCACAARAAGDEREQVSVWRADRNRGDETTGGRKGVGVRVEPRRGAQKVTLP